MAKQQKVEQKLKHQLEWSFRSAMPLDSVLATMAAG